MVLKFMPVIRLKMIMKVFGHKEGIMEDFNVSLDACMLQVDALAYALGKNLEKQMELLNWFKTEPDEEGEQGEN